jgi:DNA-binding CsgD family transcriptional regulator
MAALPALAAPADDYRPMVAAEAPAAASVKCCKMIAEGKTNKEIATVLKLSVYTVDAHRGRIMEKLNLHSATNLVRFAVRAGLVD